jgi:dTDP-4-dehydrorhamnose 3,5-epimerase
MRFQPTRLAGTYVVELEPKADERGFFARSWCQREAAAHGIAVEFVQSNLSHNPKKGTLRGMHYQHPPHQEDKLVRCITGAIFDAVIDLRPASPTRGNWFGLELSADNRRALFIPAGLAHGFVTLADNSDVLYQVSAFYNGDSADGVRWDDPAFGIAWPILPGTMSRRDAEYPDHRQAGSAP